MVVQRSSLAFQPRTHSLSGSFHQFELDRPLGFLLDYDCPITDMPA